MTTTSPVITFGLFDLEIKSDSTPSSTSDLQTFSKVDDLRTGNIERLPWASYEPDFWLLDGSYKFLPDTDAAIHVGLMSLDLSDENGDFDTPPVLTIDFGAAYSTDALTLRFSPYTGDYATDIHVQFNDGGGLIREDDYTPDSPEWSTSQAVADFTQIVITFNSTSRPFRYLRLQALDYGDVLTFDSTSIQSASIVEEIDPISSELRVNTLDFTLFSDDPDFGVLNPGAFPAPRQPISVYELVDANPVFLGQFFLESWENVSEQQIEFRCVDAIGLMDAIPCVGGLWAPSPTVGATLDLFLEAAGIGFFADETISDVLLAGYIPAGTLREAIQHIAIAVGAVVDCSRSWAVQFLPTPFAIAEDAIATLASADKGLEQALKLRPAITSVEVKGYSYTEATDTQDTLVDDTLAAGTYKYVFSQPHHTYGITGATIDDSGANYVIIIVAAPGAVEVTGYQYGEQTLTFVYDMSSTTVSGEPGLYPLRIEDATMIRGGTGTSRNRVNVAAKRVYDYFVQRYRQKVKLYAPRVEVGQTVVVDSWYGEQICGVIEKIEIDLAGGMVANVELVGSKVV